MVYIYVLELQSNKYYVGKTTNPKIRIDQHFDEIGSAWTKKYKPLNIIQLIPDCDDFDENKWTLKYMHTKGIDNVRGGSYCDIKLSQDTISHILNMINGSVDKCYICGEIGHFAKMCNKDKEKSNKQHSPLEKNQNTNRKHK